MSRNSSARELMDSDYFQNQNQQGCGLARYRSAPGSFLASLLDSNADNSSSGDESEAIFSALFDGPLDLNQKDGQYCMKQEVGVETEPRPGKSGFSGGQMRYESAVNRGGGEIVGSYSVASGNGNGSNIARQSSSPAGFFAGFGVMGEVGNYRVHDHGEPNSGLTNHMNFSSGPSSNSRFMPTIPENGSESIATRGAENHQPWNESHLNISKRTRDGDLKMFPNFNVLENQNGETRKESPGLVHHLSLPKMSGERASIEKILQFQQDSVPCQIRAKRGFATHPRSIAERVRRTRISEKMKKLQDLFPNMDKQTNTADMLDLAVEYIKDLQKQVQTLTDKREKCICSGKPKPTNPTT